MNELDGLTILRFAHAFESGGGVEKYLENLNSILLSRNRLCIVQLYLSEEDTQTAKKQNIGLGTLIKIPLRIKKSSRLINADNQTPKGKWWHFLRYLLIECIVYNRFLYKVVFKRIIRRRYPHPMAIEAINARQEVQKVFREYNVDLLIMHYIGGIDSAAIIDESLKREVPYIIINHFSNTYLTSISFREQSSGSAGIAGMSGLGVPSRLKDIFFDISDGIDVDYFKKSFARPLPIDLNAHIIICPARIVPNKGQIDLLKACIWLRREGIKGKVVFAGYIDSPKYDNELKVFTKQNGLANDVLFVGHLNTEELRDWYGISSVMAFPTYHQEGLPRILIEAQAMQVPPVVYIIGGTPAGLEDGKTGFLVPKGNIQALAERLRDLLSDDSKRREMGKEGRRFVQENFSLEALANRHEKFYQSALKKE
jgi:glycosyltransferase involved in cell wall biosynthesis